jgi:hypothetical protein
MRRLLVLSALLAAFAWSSTSYGAPSIRTLVYKGTIKASKTIFDVNDTNNLISKSIQGYWMVTIVDTGTHEGLVYDSNSVVYDARNKYYKLIPECMSADPCDPCHIVLLSFEVTDAEGNASFDVVGKGKLTKYSNDTDATKDFAPTSLKGAGLVDNFDFFDPDETYSGPVTVSLTLDSGWTRYANSGSYFYGNIIHDITAELTRKGGWTNWPHIPAP